MNDEIAEISRRVASKVANRLDPELPAKVERLLALDALEREQERVVDPISLASLIVSVVALGWTIYRDVKKDREAANAGRDALTERIASRIRERDLDEFIATEPSDRDLIIDAVAQEIARVGGSK